MDEQDDEVDNCSSDNSSNEADQEINSDVDFDVPRLNSIWLFWECSSTNCDQVSYSDPSPLHTYPRPQMQSPLSTIDHNSEVLYSSPSFGPSDQQKQKVEAMVILGKEMAFSAMAFVDVLFSDEELANSNTAGSNGFRQLDHLKLHFLMSVLCQKYDSPMFMKQWEDVKTRINTRCRGKRRTVQRTV